MYLHFLLFTCQGLFSAAARFVFSCVCIHPHILDRSQTSWTVKTPRGCVCEYVEPVAHNFKPEETSNIHPSAAPGCRLHEAVCRCLSCPRGEVLHYKCKSGGHGQGIRIRLCLQGSRGCALMKVLRDHKTKPDPVYERRETVRGGTKTGRLQKTPLEIKERIHYLQFRW